MGLTKITATITNLEKNKPGYEALFLVDTGAIDCLAPSDKLTEAGIVPEGNEIYELADGSKVEYKYGFARISFFGHETVVQVIFASNDVEPILGVVALENTKVMVDPVSRNLKAIPTKHLK